MSLIDDALKTAQRERAARAQSSPGDSPLIDGFFPYVASSPKRERSKLAPLLIVTAVAFALVGVGGWYIFRVFNPSPSPVTSAAPTTMATGARVPLPDKPATSTQAPRIIAETPAAPVTASPAPSATGQSRPAERITRPGGEMAARTPATADSASSAVRADNGPVASAERFPRARVISRPDYESEAVALFNSGDLPGARDRFQLATRTTPTARIWTNYGVVLQSLGDLAGAASAYQAAIGLDANYLEAWLYQGRLSVQRGDLAKASPLFQRARAINPRNVDVNVEMAFLEFEAKNWTESRRFAEEAVRADPTSARGHWFVAVSADQLKDADTAVREYAAYLQTVSGSDADQARFVGWARQRLAELRGKL
jgi:Tfp pilus assembly protein PilF